MKPSLKSIAIATTLSLSMLAPFYATQASTGNSTMSELKAEQAHSYMGVRIEPVPTSLQHQLGNILPQNQGILIKHVMPDSPAEKAQLQVHDIIVSFGDQKLFTPEQLTHLVRSSQAGDQVLLNIIRNGRDKTLSLTIEQKQLSETRPSRHSRPYLGHHGMTEPLFQHDQLLRHAPLLQYDPRNPMGKMAWPQTFANMMNKDWDNFQSLSLEKMKDNQYKASIEFLDKQGSKKSFQFQGSRDDIKAQLEQSEGLPAKKKQQLMNLLSSHHNPMQGVMPDLSRLVPDGFFSGQGFVN